MLQYAPQSAFMKDNNGFLPIHIGCTRHCSVEKLELLLRVHSESIFEKTMDGETTLDLAVKTANNHPNHVLIDRLRSAVAKQVDNATVEQGPTKKARMADEIRIGQN